MKKLFFILCFLCTFGAQAVTTLNVLSPMRILDPKLIAQFERENECQVNVEFVADKLGFESHIRSEIRVFDVVIADERALIQLTTTNLLRTLPERLKQSNQPHTPLQVKTVFNSEVNTYVPLFVNPIGIAYNSKVSTIPSKPTWNLLIEPEKNPFWRQHVYMTHDGLMQIAIALLAVNEPLINPKKLPKPAIEWLSKVRAQRALIDDPLENALLSGHVNAAVLFYSDYLKYKNLMQNLEFVIPEDGTHFERFGIGWCLSSTQEKLAQNFIAFMVENSEKFAKSNHLIDIKYKDSISPKIKGKEIKSPWDGKIFNLTLWTLYDESVVLPFLPSQG